MYIGTSITHVLCVYIYICRVVVLCRTFTGMFASEQVRAGGDGVRGEGNAGRARSPDRCAGVERGGGAVTTAAVADASLKAAHRPRPIFAGQTRRRQTWRVHRAPSVEPPLTFPPAIDNS